MNLYKRKPPPTVRAAQWQRGIDKIGDETIGPTGRITTELDGNRVSVVLEPGDYVGYDRYGKLFVVRKADFEDDYEPCEPETAKHSA